MKKLYYKFIAYLKHIRNKIAFYPTAFALLGLFLAFLMIYIERQGISKYFFEKFPALMVDKGDTALAILGALITGLISMMVFSFSMVMLLLSQASNNYSPRLLPGLISDKVHQIILGTFLGTILYLIFVLFAIEPSEDEYTLPGFSVLLGIMFTVGCFYAFIFFIHNISQSIQINNILDRIYEDARKRLEYLIKNEEHTEPPFPDDRDWIEYHAKKSGYLQNISYSNLISICKDHNTRLHILPVRGFFVLKGIPIFKSKEKLDEETVEKILSNLNFSRGELVEDNYLYAFKQITEIIVKAMSPGINDPGTAINGIDYLTELFSLRLQKKESDLITREEIAYLKINTIAFDEILNTVMASIRTYCKHDIVLVKKLLVMFRYVKLQSLEQGKYTPSIDKEANILLQDVQQAVSNQKDIDEMLKLAEDYDLGI